MVRIPISPAARNAARYPKICLSKSSMHMEAYYISHKGLNVNVWFGKIAAELLPPRHQIATRFCYDGDGRSLDQTRRFWYDVSTEEKHGDQDPDRR